MCVKRFTVKIICVERFRVKIVRLFISKNPPRKRRIFCFGNLAGRKTAKVLSGIIARIAF